MEAFLLYPRSENGQIFKLYRISRQTPLLAEYTRIPRLSAELSVYCRDITWSSGAKINKKCPRFLACISRLRTRREDNLNVQK